jgi:hypothetical protein
MATIEFESNLANGQAVYVVANAGDFDIQSVVRISDDQYITDQISAEDRQILETHAFEEWRDQIYGARECMDGAA